jgi:hypothetical protein
MLLRDASVQMTVFLLTNAQQRKSVCLPQFLQRISVTLEAQYLAILAELLRVAVHVGQKTERVRNHRMDEFASICSRDRANDVILSNNLA